MKAHPLRYLSAYAWAISAIGPSVALVVCLTWRYPPTVTYLSESLSLLTFIVGIVAELCLYALLAMLFVSPFVCMACAKLNGAPFKEGELVCILASRHRGRIVRIYDVWDCRGQVRVDLGERERKAVTDVFSYCEVWRQRNVVANTSEPR